MILMNWRALQHVNTSSYINYQLEDTQVKFFQDSQSQTVLIASRTKNA